MGFWQELKESIAAKDSLLCVGIDPVEERIPSRFSSVADFCMYIVDETRDVACAYKPNIAFFEALGETGMNALRRLLEHIGESSTPVILDAKRNDIGSTARAYAEAVFDDLGVGAVTVNPYLGADGVKPFLAQADRGVFVLCRTSNPSAGELQDWSQNGEPLYWRVAQLATEWAGPDAEIGLVMGATYGAEMAEVRRLAPDAWFLVPGVGAQGGDLQEVLETGLRADGQGVIINASRSILYAADPQAAAMALREEINRERRAVAARPAGVDAHGVELDRLARVLYDCGCIRFGEFRLHSGAISPIYIDLRLLVSSPEALQTVARVYARLLAGLSYDRLAGIPYAALPIGTAVSLQVGKPLIYARKEAKAYGTKQLIEGGYAAGERIALVDDLISSGGSKIEALVPLLEAGLIVEDIVVLIDRQQGGAEELAQKGYRLHAACTLVDLVRSLARQGCIEQFAADQVLAYIAEQGQGR